MKSGNTGPARIGAWTAALCLLLLPGGAHAEEFTSDFALEGCTFSHDGENPFFSLEVGTQSILEGEEQGEEVSVQITVLPQTRWVTFGTSSGEGLRVRTRVVEEREWVDGEIAEISRNFFARCVETSDIYYFGEEVDIFEDGEIVSHGGAWLAGADAALPGLIMPGTFLLGSRYLQEVAPGVALDRAEHAAMGFSVDVPAGSFEDCVEVFETSGLDPSSRGTKIYCRDVGLVIDEVLELVEHTDD
jgi:hypothetical protein